MDLPCSKIKTLTVKRGYYGEGRIEGTWQVEVNKGHLVISVETFAGEYILLYFRREGKGPTTSLAGDRKVILLEGGGRGQCME